jgi:N-acetylglucosaminyldiphosphoundecaprenol N-acetyl-beta-D-mannosaminyltransferase
MHGQLMHCIAQGRCYHVRRIRADRRSQRVSQEIRVSSSPAPSPSAAAERYDVLGVDVSVVTPRTALERLVEWSRDEQGRYVCVRDVHGIMHARHDAEFSRIHREADMVTPDGRPVALVGRMRGLPVEQTCGPELMLAVMHASPAHGLKHYLYGAADGVAQQLAERLRGQVPGLDIVGVETPPFRALADAELVELAERLNGSGADMVWIGLSTPKQEKLMHRLRPHVRATMLGVGAAFDIHAGRMRRPPRWVQRSYLEGIYRLLKEPRRLWRRYLVLAPQFAVLAAIAEVRRKLGPTPAGGARG